jgi:NTP pyrophosphatase (non-canonical NTP hydrolase)
MVSDSFGRNSFDHMVEAVRRLHLKHRLRELGGEEMTYRVALMAEELGEISSCVTKGMDRSKLAEENADLLILILGTAIAQDLNLEGAVWDKMAKLEEREGRMISGRIRVSEYRGSGDG